MLSLKLPYSHPIFPPSMGRRLDLGSGLCHRKCPGLPIANGRLAPCVQLPPLIVDADRVKRARDIGACPPLYGLAGEARSVRNPAAHSHFRREGDELVEGFAPAIMEAHIRVLFGAF